MIGMPTSNEYMHFVAERRPDQMLYLLDSWPYNEGTIRGFRDKLEASEFSDSEFNEYVVEHWDGEVNISEFIDWLEQDLYDNSIFNELKKRREKDAKQEPDRCHEGHG
jgi:hypothetical protein